MKILALDLGLNKTVGCVLDAEAHEHEFRSIRTNQDELKTLILETRPTRVVIEICTIAGWVLDLCTELGCEIEVANTSHDAWRWKNTRRKTDRDDALKLAQLSLMHQLPTVHVPSRQVRQWRSLIGYRQSIVRRRTGIKNHIRALLLAHGMRLNSGRRGWNLASIDELRKLSTHTTDSEHEVWKTELAIELDQYESVTGALSAVEKKLDAIAASQERVTLVRTIPGVGPRLAEALVAVIDDPHRFRSGRQVGSYAGLVPKQYQSGEMDRRGRISRHGNPILRALLVEVSWLGLRYNPMILRCI